MAREPTDSVAFTLRFDEQLRRRLEKEALQNNESLNGEMVRRLNQSFDFE